VGVTDDRPQATKFVAPVLCTYRGVVLGSGGGSSAGVRAAESEYVAMDNALFDMNPALTGDGSTAVAAAPPGHMVTWMNGCVLHRSRLPPIYRHVRAREAGWPIHSSEMMLRRDTVKDLAAVTVSLCEEEPPTWVEMVVVPSRRQQQPLGHRAAPSRGAHEGRPGRPDPATKHGMYRGTGPRTAWRRTSGGRVRARASSRIGGTGPPRSTSAPLLHGQLQLVGGPDLRPPGRPVPAVRVRTEAGPQQRLKSRALRSEFLVFIYQPNYTCILVQYSTTYVTAFYTHINNKKFPTLPMRHVHGKGVENRYRIGPPHLLEKASIDAASQDRLGSSSDRCCCKSRNFLLACLLLRSTLSPSPSSKSAGTRAATPP
jgi:hypothetical protein